MHVLKKRRYIPILLILIIVISIVFFFLKKDVGDVSNVSRKVTASEVYSQKDINDAMDAVVKYFRNHFEGCKLTQLCYKDSTSVTESGGWAIQYNADQAIVLLSTFDVDAAGGDGSFNPNETYSDWQWILVRNKGGAWEVKTWGY